MSIMYFCLQKLTPYIQGRIGSKGIILDWNFTPKHYMTLENHLKPIFKILIENFQ